ncbi:SRPBCC family protein [Streptomyces mobaraensis]|uniref:SRPBCC family protein n=1 Tax=Streptomyces mobaraensis TaxID=35621 RepID=A0A5N5WBD5_STRMB|nr:SRPBCC family protein [Streptomyces mobaraensis]KAB7848572.1 SRPBCC family protein [Streptomyces mobaraensis]
MTTSVDRPSGQPTPLPGYVPPAPIPDGIKDVPGLLRWETTPREEAMALAAELTKESFTYDEVYGRFVTVHQYIDAPPRAVYEYLTDIRHLNEFTYSTRDFAPTDVPDVYQGRDVLLDDVTKIFMRIDGDPDALTVDIRCAWDQGEELWMNYLHRIVPAETVLNKPGSVVIWTNCRHPYYDKNPYPELAPSPERPWVGDMWPLFYAGHQVEMDNLKKILEHRFGGDAAS